MPNDQDLFTEEQSMVTMSFGDHIEELRVRLILALLGLFVGVVVVFLPPLDIAWQVMKSMEGPAKIALDEFYRPSTTRKPSKPGRRSRLHHCFRRPSRPARSSPSSRRSPPSSSFPSQKRSKIKG